MTTATERNPVRSATPYLEVETWSTFWLERMIERQRAEARLVAKRAKRKAGDQPPSIQTGLVQKTRIDGLGGDQS